jgi:hypothetical protein
VSDHDPNEETIASLLHTVALIREAAGCEGVMLAEFPSKIATLRADLAIAKTDLLLTQARVERFRAELAALKKADPLNDAANEACVQLPEDWVVRIDLSLGSATVEVFDADGELAFEVYEDKTSVSGLVREAIRRAKETKP